MKDVYVVWAVVLVAVISATIVLYNMTDAAKMDQCSRMCGAVGVANYSFEAYKVGGCECRSR